MRYKQCEILISGKPSKKETHKYDSEGPFAVGIKKFTYQRFVEGMHFTFEEIEEEIKNHATVHSNKYILDLQKGLFTETCQSFFPKNHNKIQG